MSFEIASYLAMTLKLPWAFPYGAGYPLIYAGLSYGPVSAFIPNASNAFF